MRYIFSVMLIVVILCSICLASCRLLNRGDQSSDSQSSAPATQQETPDTLAGPDDQANPQTGDSDAQPDGPNSPSLSHPAIPLKVELAIVRGVVVQDGVSIGVQYGVNQKASLTLTVAYPDGSTKDIISNRVCDAGPSGGYIHVGSDKGTGHGTITLTAAVPGGLRDSASVSYVISPNTMNNANSENNTNVLWGDYQYVNPSH